MSTSDLRDEIAVLHAAIGMSSPPAGWTIVTDDDGFEASWMGTSEQWACVRGVVSADPPAEAAAAVTSARRLGAGWLQLTCRMSDPGDLAVAGAAYALLDALPSHGRP